MKIACLGSAPSSMMLAPVDDPEWEIWACSPPNFQQKRVDAWFEVHSLERKFSKPENAPYAEVLKKHQRVYVTDPKHKEILPNSLMLPWQELVSQYGPYFFTSSLAWMMAYALMHKPDKIGLFGVDMAAQTEYGYQRAGCQYFIQKAHEMGIDVYCPPQSDVKVPAPIYGVREHWHMFKKCSARRNELLERKQKADAAIQNAQRDSDLIRGALDDLQYVENTWLQPNWIEVNANAPVDPQQDTDEDGSSASNG